MAASLLPPMFQCPLDDAVAEVLSIKGQQDLAASQHETLPDALGIPRWRLSQRAAFEPQIFGDVTSHLHSCAACLERNVF